MRNLPSRVWLVGLLATSSAPGFAAVDVVECQNAGGERSFSSTCPPGSTQVGSRSVGGGDKEDEDPNANISATVYVIPDCDACLDVKEFLNIRKILYKEKFVHDDLKIQAELKEVTGGTLAAPTTVINEEVVTGYSREKLTNALRAAGYVKPPEEDPRAKK